MSEENKEMSTETGTGTKGSPDKEKKKGFFFRLSLPKKIILIIVVILLIAAAAAGITFAVITGRGKEALFSVNRDEDIMSKAQTVEYNGKTYVYNDKIINILAMGVDLKTTIPYIREHIDDEDIQLKWNGGQADALFLITIDTENRKISVMPINRNSMTELKYYDPAEEAYFTDEGPICIQHGFGTGLEDSCELQVRSVSKMLYNIPINAYIAINLPAISALNHTVGGVEVEVLEDIPPVAHGDYDYGIGDSLTGVVGQKITLNDNQAYAYIRYREMTNVNSNENRVNRQKQYIKALAKKMVSMTKKDLTFPFKVKDALTDYMVTDIDSDELIFLGSLALGYSIDLENMEGLPGELYLRSETAIGYRLDQEALQALIIRKFYKEKGNP